MKTLEYQVVLKNDAGIGSRVPPTLVAPLFAELPRALGQATLMAFEGRSSKTGSKPRWLQDASDIRFLRASGDYDTVLHFDAPRLGDAASMLYEQSELWPTQPSPDDTAFDLLGDVISDVGRRDENSERYDLPLLQRLTAFRQVLNGTVYEIDLVGHRYSRTPAVVNAATVEAAQTLVAEIPDPQRVRVVGSLDMIRESTQTFNLVLDSGQRVRGVLTNGTLTDVRMLFRQRVLVLGMAIYQPSGRVLRIDAEGIEPGEGERAFWSTVPAPRRRRFEPRELRQSQDGRSGAAAIFGKWPGDETEEELLAALREMG